MSTVTLTGENSWARTAALRALVADFVAANGDLALERLDGEEAEFARISEALTSLPFLANKKMVVLSRPSANKPFAEAAEQLLADLPETTELVLVEPRFDKRSGLYKLLQKTTDYREFTQTIGAALEQWLIEQAGERGASLDRANARFLIERIGEDQQVLASEIAKLADYNSRIDKASIELLVEPTPRSSSFDLLDAAFAGQTAKALQLYDEQRRQRVEPIVIIGALAWQLHIMALIVAAGQRSPADIAAQAKVSPYPIKKSLALAKRLGRTRLKQIIAELLTIDRRSKQVSYDLDDALKQFVIKLAS